MTRFESEVDPSIDFFLDAMRSVINWTFPIHDAAGVETSISLDACNRPFTISNTNGHLNCH